MSFIRTLRLDPQAQTIRETTTRADQFEALDFNPMEQLRETVYTRNGVLARNNFLEAFVQTPDAGNLLRDGVRYLAFTRYNEIPANWQAFVMEQSSNRPQEEYLRDAAMGALPKYKSGDNTTVIKSSFEGAALVKNDQYRALVEVSMDEVRFDRLGKIAQIAQEMGRSGRITEAKAAFDVLTSTANYVRSNTTGDNDVGANTQNLTFSGTGLETALTIIGTAKDRKSGAYLGFQADTLICGPRLEYAAKQLLMSDTIDREGGNTTNEVRGTGTKSPYFNIVKNVIVSPWFSSTYEWALMDSTMKPVVFQRVEPFNVMEEGGGMTSESYLNRDVLRYLVMGYFGVGMVDDRSIFYSSSSTAPVVS